MYLDLTFTKKIQLEACAAVFEPPLVFLLTLISFREQKCGSVDSRGEFLEMGKGEIELLRGKAGASCISYVVCTLKLMCYVK